MRRRSYAETERGTPRKLAYFDPTDWGDDEDAPTRWYAARDRWAAEHAEQPQTDPASPLPDVPFRYEDI